MNFENHKKTNMFDNKSIELMVFKRNSQQNLSGSVHSFAAGKCQYQRQLWSQGSWTPLAEDWKGAATAPICYEFLGGSINYATLL